MLSNCVLKIVIGFCNLKKKNTLIHKIAQLLITQPGLEKKMILLSYLREVPVNITPSESLRQKKMSHKNFQMCLLGGNEIIGKLYCSRFLIDIFSSRMVYLYWILNICTFR